MSAMDDLARQRRASVHAAVLRLLEHGANTVAELAIIAAPMNAQDLADAAEERALAGGRSDNTLAYSPNCDQNPRQNNIMDRQNIQLLTTVFSS